MNLYERAAEIFRKNGVPIANYTKDDAEMMKENEGTSFYPVYVYDSTEIVQTFNAEE